MSNYDAWKTRSPDDDRPPDEYDEMPEEDEDMSSDARFIWCDIDGRGKKWRLAVSREMDDGEDGLYFPIEDFEDLAEGYADYPVKPVIAPEPLIAGDAK